MLWSCHLNKVAAYLTASKVYQRLRRCGTMEEPASNVKEYSFPATYLLAVMGFPSYSKKPVQNYSFAILRSLFNGFLRFLFAVYLVACFLWIIGFGISVFTYELGRFAKDRASGVGRESDIIIRLLDNVPWVATMTRNFVILLLFFCQNSHLDKLTYRLRCLLLFFHPAEDGDPIRPLRNNSLKFLLTSWAVVVVNCAMVLMYFFNPDFSDYLKTQWNFHPIPVKLTGWRVSIFLCLFTFPPFFLAQIVISSYVGTVAGGCKLIKLLNHTLDCLPTSQRLLSSSEVTQKGEPTTLFVENQKSMEAYGSLSIYRQMHFQIGNYVHSVSDRTNLIFLTAVAADFASAVGYIGLLIGKTPSPGSRFPDYPKIYHAIATFTWMTFYLCGQYWPLIALPEEAEKTHHRLQRLSFIPAFMATKRMERELTYFLLATKDTFMGIIVGKLLIFSRHLCVTVITLLLSYGVLVYELIHRDRLGSPHGSPITGNVTLSEPDEAVMGESIIDAVNSSMSTPSF